MYKYSYKIFWHKEDECYYAKVLGISKWKHIACGGETPEEALSEIKAVINGLIETYKERGEDIPEPKYETIQ
jgi:predicted RNase H-like HicB family nuclease